MTDVTPEAQAEPTEPTTEAPETQEAPQLGIDPALDARLNELGQSIGQLTQGFQQLQEAQYEDPYQQQYDQQFQQQQDQFNGLDPNDPAHALLLQQQQQYAQLQQQTQQLQEDAYRQQMQAVFDKIPALHQPEVDNAVTQILAQNGYDPRNPQVRVPPGIVEMAYGKYMADQYAAKQQPISQVQQGQATLENAGASPQQPQQDPLDEYFPAGQQDPGNVFGIRR